MPGAIVIVFLAFLVLPSEWPRVLDDLCSLSQDSESSVLPTRVAQLVSARPSMREVPSSIPGDITSLSQLLSFLCSFD